MPFFPECTTFTEGECMCERLTFNHVGQDAHPGFEEYEKNVCLSV